MSRQRKRHPFVVIAEEADKAAKRGIPYDGRWVWTDYDAAMAYRGKKSSTKNRIPSLQTLLIFKEGNDD